MRSTAEQRYSKQASGGTGARLSAPLTDLLLAKVSHENCDLSMIKRLDPERFNANITEMTTMLALQHDILFRFSVPIILGALFVNNTVEIAQARSRSGIKYLI
jgi:hypothetical protein